MSQLSFKRCGVCGKLKSFIDFGKDKYAKDKLRSTCKECHNKKNTEYQRSSFKWKLYLKNYMRNYMRKRALEYPDYIVTTCKKSTWKKRTVPYKERSPMWSEEEIAILKSMYPKGGIKQIRKYLITRSDKGIREKVYSLGLKRE